MLKIQALLIDAHDPQALATFWQAALGWRITLAEADEVVLEPPGGSPADGVAADLLFLRGDEAKAQKNRLHLDLRPEAAGRRAGRLEDWGRSGCRWARATICRGWSWPTRRETSSVSCEPTGPTNWSDCRLRTDHRCLTGRQEPPAGLG